MSFLWSRQSVKSCLAKVPANKRDSLSSLVMEPEHTPNPQVSRGIYGFVMYLFFVSFIIVYMLWLLIPVEMTHSWTYEPPQKYWAIAVPIFFCTGLFLFAFCIYPAMCSRHDGALDEPSAVRDKFAVRNIRGKASLEIPLYDFSYELGGTTEPRRRERTNTGSSKWKLYDENAPKTIINRAIAPACDLDPLDVSKLLYLPKDGK